MENKNMQLSYAPTEMVFSYCGEGNIPMREMKSVLKQQICLLCYDSAKTVDELSNVLQCNKAYIIDAVKTLCNLGMMKDAGEVNEKFLTCFPLWNENISVSASKIAYDYALKNEIPKKLNDMLKKIQSEIESIGFYGSNFKIEYLNWFLYKVACDLLCKSLGSYYQSKTDEVMIDKEYWRTNKRTFTTEGFYHYADEKVEGFECDKYWQYYSTFYNRYGNYHICNVFDAAPFPYAWTETGFDFEGGRNMYLNGNSFDIYLKLIKNPEDENFTKPTEEIQKILDDFIEHGVAEKSGNSYKGLVPVFTTEQFEQLKSVIAKEIKSIAKEIAENIGTKVEEILLPTMKGVKEREDQFYLTWLSSFLDPLKMLIWYGMNVEGLEIPKDYKKSSAGIYISQDE